MAITEVSSGLSRLMEALEKLGTSTGAGLHNPAGPSGQPEQELVRAFEEALQQANASQQPDAVQGIPQQEIQQGQQAAQHEPQPAPEKIDADFRLWDASENISIEPTKPTAKAAVTDEQIHTINPASPFAQQPSVTYNAEHSFTEQLCELGEIMNRMNTGVLSPQDLYRMQYITGMLKVQASSGVKVSQQTTQGFESLLKQQG